MDKQTKLTPATAYFISPYTDRSVPALKFASLYFDHVVLQQSAILATLPVNVPDGQSPSALGPKAPMPMVDDRFLSQVRPLTQAGILSIRGIVDERRDVAALDTVKAALRGLLRERPDLIALESQSWIRNRRGERVLDHIEIKMPKEVRAVITKHYGELMQGTTLPLDFMYAYFGALLGEALYLMSQGGFAITGSEVLDAMMQYALGHDRVVRSWATTVTPGAVAPAVAHGLMKLTLPDVSGLSFEEILEARDRLGPELARLRDAVSRLSRFMSESHNTANLLRDLPAELQAHAVPAVNDMRGSIRMSRNKLIAGLATALAVPLVGTLLTGLPEYIRVIGSLAASAAGPVTMYVMDKRELARNGLYVLIRLDDQLRKRVDE